MNGAALVAEILKREGTEFLACYPRNPLIEACAALDIRPILCRQERVGVGMADGYTRIKRGKRNGVFAAQAGPGIENAFFSILAPGKVIPSHHGVTKGLVRCHLGLIVPPEPERCFMDVGDVRCTWQEGRTLLFDDTYPHAVQNDTEHERVVLLFDFLRPLTTQGRLVRRMLFGFFRRSAFVQDAVRKEMQWEQRFHREFDMSGAPRSR